MRLTWGMFVFLLGPNLLMLATRLDPYPGLFLQSVGCIATAYISWFGGNIIRQEKRKWDDRKSD